MSVLSDRPLSGLYNGDGGVPLIPIDFDKVHNGTRDTHQHETRKRIDRIYVAIC